MQNDKYKFEIGTIFKDDKRDLIIINKEYRISKNNQKLKWYQYKCNKCGWSSWIQEYTLLRGQGCACCCFSPRIIILGINSIWDTDIWMYYLGMNKKDCQTNTRSSGKKVSVKCPLCGRIKEMKICNIYNRKSIGCICKDGKSYPEKFMFNILEQLTVKFETEYSPDWIKPKRYDFYFELNGKKYIIEMDGIFHFQDNKMNKKTEKESIEIDYYKDKLAKENNIEVIRIDCKESNFEYIKNNIINSKLNKLFILSIIDWNKAEEFALSNLVKITCDYKNNNPKLTTIDIGRLMNLSNITIVRYLKKGSKLGWCNYNPKEELIKSVSKNGKLNGKQVEILKNNISLGIFKSSCELERQSEKLFGIKLFRSYISTVCLGKIEHYKGFTFKYI